MKTLSAIFVILTLMLVPISIASGVERSEAERTQIADNLKAGLVSENEGLRLSSAQVLSSLIDTKVIKENDASGSLIPLVKMLNDGRTDEERIIAAVALYKMGNKIGIHSLKDAARFDKSPRVRKHAKDFYFNYHLQNRTTYLLDF